MNKLLKRKKGLKGGEEGTKFVPLRAAGAGGASSQKVKKNPPKHKLAYNGDKDKSNSTE